MFKQQSLRFIIPITFRKWHLRKVRVTVQGGRKSIKEKLLAGTGLGENGKIQTLATLLYTRPIFLAWNELPHNVGDAISIPGNQIVIFIAQIGELIRARASFFNKIHCDASTYHDYIIVSLFCLFIHWFVCRLKILKLILTTS